MLIILGNARLNKGLAAGFVKMSEERIRDIKNSMRDEKN